MVIVQFMASEKWGGAEKVFVEISNGLSSRHHVIAILLRNTEYRDRFLDKVEIRELQSHPTRHNPMLLLELYLILKKLSPDIVHTHAAKASALVGNVSRFLKVNHLATKHNARRGRVFNRLPWITVVSEEARRSLLPKGMVEVRVINNGVSPREIKDYPRTLDFSIAAIGRLDKIKGFDILIDQVEKLTIPYRLSIVGEGKEYKNLQDKILFHGLQEKISLVGFRQDIPEVMRRADLIVISSHSEGFSQVMVESLFYANVLIATPVGGATEVLPPVFLVGQNEIARKITEVAADYSFYFSHFQLLQEEKRGDFLLSKIIKQYEDVYQEITTT